MTFCYTKMKTVDFSQRLKTIRHLFGLSMEQLVQQIYECLPCFEGRAYTARSSACILSSCS